MGKFKVTYVDSISHEIIVEAETKEDASYKLPAWKPGDGYRRITSIEPVIEEYEITYEHGDRHSRRTETIKVAANSIQEAREKIPHTSGDEFCIVTNIKSVNKEKNKEDQEEER